MNKLSAGYKEIFITNISKIIRIVIDLTVLGYFKSECKIPKVKLWWIYLVIALLLKYIA